MAANFCLPTPRSHIVHNTLAPLYRGSLSVNAKAMILRAETIAGFEARRVCGLRCRLAQDFWTADDVAREMKVAPQPTAKKPIAALHSSGSGESAYISPEAFGGIRLLATPWPTLPTRSRSTAKPARTGWQFLNRVRVRNADDVWAYRVTKVVVFGSYITKKSYLGALSFACGLLDAPKGGRRTATLPRFAIAAGN